MVSRDWRDYQTDYEISTRRINVIRCHLMIKPRDYDPLEMYWPSGQAHWTQFYRDAQADNTA